MILSGDSIQKAVGLGDIAISPFDERNVNPNSYNYRLNKQLFTCCEITNNLIGITIPDSGLILKPKRIYLGSTYELIGSRKYAMTLLGRSSVGRLGLFLNVSADLGHVGSESKWTLELTSIQPIKVYPYMVIGQIAFWSTTGFVSYYEGRYHRDLCPTPNKDTNIEKYKREVA